MKKTAVPTSAITNSASTTTCFPEEERKRKIVYSDNIEPNALKQKRLNTKPLSAALWREAAESTVG
jgi:hypothetical protein